MTQEISTYQTLLLQYKNQLLQATGLGQAAQIYSQAQGAMGQVLGTVNMFRSGAGVEGYISQFKDLNYWLASAPTSQTASQSATYWSSAQKTAGEQLVKEIQQQEQQIQSDSSLLQRLQSQAGSVATYRQAMDVSNELSSLQSKQLMEIRSLLVSEQQSLAARSGTVANQEAMQQAATQTYYHTILGPQPHTGW